MQEELEHRTVTLMISSGKFTGRTLKSAMTHFLHYSKNKVQEHKNVVPHGKQSVKQLVGQNAGVENVEIGDDINLRSFKKIAGKYGVDYAVKKIEKDGKPQFLVFFKSRDKDAITTAMTEYVNNFVEHGREERPSIHKMIAAFREMIKGMDKDRAVRREISR